MVHERSGEATAANVGVRLDRLEPRQRGAGRDEAHLRHERSVEEGAEPGAVTGLDESPVARHPPLDERAVADWLVLVVAGERQLDALSPVSVGLERAVGRLAVRVGGR